MSDRSFLKSLVLLCSLLVGVSSLTAELVFTDSFERPDGSSTEDAAGNGWTTNSAWRADGKKQVFLNNGVLEIRRL
ncbi:MAG: hypothetical protein P8L44_18440 [Opitutales bacterium]|nr:hypothetical protein [Opitutales bacterium]